MAQVTNIRLVDDIDGTGADESVSFGIDGRSLEIDLSNENAEKLRAVFAPYIAAARRGDRRAARPQPARQESAERQPVERRPVERRPSASTPVFSPDDTGPTDQDRSAGPRKAALPKIGNPFQVDAG
jgi:Lsr2